MNQNSAKEICGIKEIKKDDIKRGIFAGINLEQLLGNDGQDAIIAENERARAAYEATLRKR